MKKFVLVDGYVSMDNKQLFVDVNQTKKDVKQRGGWLGVFFTLLGISLFHSIKSVDYFKNAFYYFDFGLRVLGMIGIVAIFYYLFFLRKSKKNLIINEIIKIDIDKFEFETEVTLVFSSKRQFDISFRNLENQIEPFIEELKKRNARAIIFNQ